MTSREEFLHQAGRSRQSLAVEFGAAQNHSPLMALLCVIPVSDKVQWTCAQTDS